MRRWLRAGLVAAAVSLAFSFFFLYCCGLRLCKLAKHVVEVGVSPWVQEDRRLMVEALLYAVAYRGLLPTGVVAGAAAVWGLRRALRGLAVAWAARIMEVVLFAVSASGATGLFVELYPLIVLLLQGLVEIGGTLYAYYLAYLDGVVSLRRGVLTIIGAGLFSTLIMFIAGFLAPPVLLESVPGAKCLEVTLSSLAGGAAFAFTYAALLAFSATSGRTTPSEASQPAGPEA